MKESEICEQITALVDNELDAVQASLLKKRIDENPDLREEYEIQYQVKHLLCNRFANNSAPNYLINSIKKSIGDKFDFDTNKAYD
ncbi:MAG: hypothetical protein QY331_12400 [Melioribacteraceae bacterium]|nr:hypothetical protein [Melioribacteraceae bacterium]WKZ68752.1 MAG: hypothetical protein QY331_12400 [Melioribacteraceae bacterium]